MPLSDDESLDLETIFKEPPRPPTPEPTITKYIRDNKQIYTSDKDWREIEIMLVGTHPLWGHYLWNAALALASFLDSNRDLYVGRNGLELGAGGGLPSIVAVKNGARKVVVTDYPDTDLIENLSRNVARNLGAEEMGRVDVQGYIWGQPVHSLLEPLQSPKFDLIILSDLIFNHSQHDALLKTCECVISSNTLQVSTTTPDPCVLVFYTHHLPHFAHRDMQFFIKAKERGWICTEIFTKIFPPMFPEDPGEESIRSTVHGWKLVR